MAYNLLLYKRRQHRKKIGHHVQMADKGFSRKKANELIVLLRYELYKTLKIKSS